MDFLTEHFAINFPVFQETSLAENPIYQKLQAQLPGQPVRHNFFKYLVGRDGVAVELFPKKMDPHELAPIIEDMLETKTTE